MVDSFLLTVTNDHLKNENKRKYKFSRMLSLIIVTALLQYCHSIVTASYLPMYAVIESLLDVLNVGQAATENDDQNKSVEANLESHALCFFTSPSFPDFSFPGLFHGVPRLRKGKKRVCVRN